MKLSAVFRSFAATVQAELAMRLRSRRLLTVIFVLLALCALLTPAPNANYAIIQVGGLVPQMGPDTALLVAGIVVNVLMILIFSLVLDVGNARDARLRLTQTLRTQPEDPRFLVLARASANLVYGAGLCIFADVALSVTLAFRYDGLPSFEAFILFLALVLPAIMVTIIAGMAIDLTLPPNPLLRTFALVVFWVAVLIFSLNGGLDMIGTKSLIKLLGPEQHGADLSLGFLPVTEGSRFAWQSLPDSKFGILAGQGVSFIALVMVGVVGASTLGGLIHRNGQPMWQAKAITGVPTVAPAKPEPEVPPRKPVQLAWIGFIATAQRLYRSSPFAIALLLAAAGTGLALPEHASIAIIMLAVVPLLIANRISDPELVLSRSLEACEPALQKPTADFVHAVSIVGPMLLAAGFALAGMPVVQALTASSGLIALAFWESVAFRRFGTPLLGTAIACIALYVFGFNDPPPELDLLGLYNPSLAALTISAACAMVLIGLAVRR